MEGVDTDAHVELVFAAVLHHVFVGTDTCRLESLTRQLLILVRNKMDTERELVNRCLLSTQVKDSNLGVCVCVCVILILSQ